MSMNNPSSSTVSILSASSNAKVNPWSQFICREFGTHSGFQKSVFQVSWSKGGSNPGEYLSAIGGDRSVRISQLTASISSSNTLQQIHSIPTSTLMSQVAWHPIEAGRLAFCGEDKVMEVWDVRSSRAALKFPTLGGNLNLSFSRNGNSLVVGNRSDIFLLFDLRTGAQVCKQKFTHEMNEIVWSADEDHFFVAASVDGMGALEVVRVDDSSMNIVKSSAAHTASCLHLTADSNLTRAVLGSSDHYASIWSLADMTLTGMVSADSEIRGVSFSGDGENFAIISMEPGVLICDAASGEGLAKVQTRNKISYIAWHPTAKVLAAADEKSGVAPGLQVISFPTGKQ